MKTCNKCKQRKPLTAFYSNGGGYRKSRCKVCVNQASKKYHARNRELISDRRRAKYWADPATGRARAYAYRKKNPEAHRESVRRWQRLNRDKKAGYDRYGKYKITPAQFQEKLLQQKHRCAICGRPETAKLRGVIKQLHVDHDHETKNLRGLLCQRCNLGLGNFLDNPATLRAAADYLEQYNGHLSISASPAA